MEKYSKDELINKFKNLKLLCLDADGTLTDGGMYLGEDNIAIRRFFAHDGTGISMIRNIGVQVALITTSVSPIMKERAAILSLDHVVVGSFDKGTAIKELYEKLGLKKEEVAHMGDDVNDILGFEQVGLPIAVNNSAEVIFDYVRYITSKKGGEGAVREICDLILLAKTSKLYGPPYVGKSLKQ